MTDQPNSCPTHAMRDPFAALFVNPEETELIEVKTPGTILPREMEVQFVHGLPVKLLYPEARIPSRASEHAAGLDLYAAWVSGCGSRMLEVGTGIAVAIPEGYAGFIFPRSSITATSLRLANCVGVIDSDYRGEIKFRFDDLDYNDSERPYEVGDRVGQLILMPVPRFEPIAVESLPETIRGNGGYGSTGR